MDDDDVLIERARASRASAIAMREEARRERERAEVACEAARRLSLRVEALRRRLHDG